MNSKDVQKIEKILNKNMDGVDPTPAMFVCQPDVNEPGNFAYTGSANPMMLANLMNFVIKRFIETVGPEAAVDITGDILSATIEAYGGEEGGTAQ